MKNLILSLAFVLLGSVVFASNNTNQPSNFNGVVSISQKVTNEKTVMNLQFSDVKSFKNFNAQQLSQLFSVDECTMSISVTVTVNVGLGSASCTLTAENIPCKDVAQKIKELKAMCLAALR